MDRSVVDAGFAPGAAPRIGDRLQVGELALEVVAHRGGGVVRAIALGSTDGLRRGAEVTDTGQPLLVPVGAASLGRVLGPTGAVTDGLGPIDLPGAAGAVRRPIHGPPPPFAEVSGAVERLETGIKAIDLLAPLRRGGVNGLVDRSRTQPAAVQCDLGRGALCAELAHRIAARHGGRTVVAEVGRPTGAARELWAAMCDGGVFVPGADGPIVSWVSAPADATPAARVRVAATALAIAEGLRDEGFSDVLLLVDDLSTLAEAAREEADLLGRPDVGLGPLLERLGLTRRGAVTAWGSTETADEVAFDATVALSRRVAEAGMFPPIDPVRSTSALLEPAIVGEAAVRVAAGVRALLARCRDLQSELDRVGMDELDAVDRRTVARARKVLWLLTQPLHVYAPFIGLPGVYVTAADTVAGFEALLDGRADDLPEDALIMVGGLDTAIAKARRLDP